jgi:hypothetical protein
MEPPNLPTPGKHRAHIATRTATRPLASQDRKCYECKLFNLIQSAEISGWASATPERGRNGMLHRDGIRLTRTRGQRFRWHARNDKGQPAAEQTMAYQKKKSRTLPAYDWGVAAVIAGGVRLLTPSSTQAVKYS